MTKRGRSKEVNSDEWRSSGGREEVLKQRETKERANNRLEDEALKMAE